MKLSRQYRLLTLSFVESLGTVLLERGAYFYTHEVLRFSDLANLALALMFGVVYAVGALCSHTLAARLGERRLLLLTLAALLALHVVLAGWPRGVVLVLAYQAVGLVQGLKWPVIESYVAAGHTPEATLGVLSRFNVSWALAVPVGVALTGPLVASPSPTSLFWLAAAGNVVALALAAALPARPPHRAETASSALDTATQEQYVALLRSARWAMIASYSFLFLVAPLLPGVFTRLSLPVHEATVLASLLDVIRVIAFGALGVFVGWRGRSSPLLLSLVALPAGLGLMLFSPNVWWLLLGELVFGLAAGLTYYAALYYAIVLGSASVEAGGAHEGLIGIGLALGPLSGIAAELLVTRGHPDKAAFLLSVSPIFLWSALGASRAALRAAGIAARRT